MGLEPTDNFDQSLTFKEQLNLQRLNQIDRVGAVDGLGAAFNLAQQDTAVMSWARISSLNDLNDRGGKKLGANELNQKFPGLPEPFTQPMTIGAAIEVDRRQKERGKLAQTVQAGPKSNFYKLGSFGAALTAHMMDPLEFGAGAMADGLFAAGAAGKATATLFRTPVKQLTLSGRLARGGLSGLAGNLAVEPIIYSAAQQDLTDYTLHDTFVSVVGGAIGFPVFKEVARFGLGKAARFFGRMPLKKQEATQRAAVAHISQDKRVNIDAIINDTVKETDGKLNVKLPGPNEQKYKFKAINETARAEDRPFYGASEKSTKNLDKAEFTQIDDDFGNGQYLSDNPNVANGKAGGKFRKAPGGLFAIRLKPVKLFDMEIPMDPRGVNKLAMLKIFGDHPLIQSAITGREVFEAAKVLIQQGVLNADKITELNNFFRDLGFDGYRFISKQDMSIAKDPHNTLMLFSKNKIALSETLKPDGTAVPRPSRADVQKSIDERTSQKSDLDFDKEGFDEITVLKDSEVEPLQAKKLEDDLNFLKEEVKSLDDQGLLTPELKKQFDELQALAGKGDLEDRAVKAVIACVGR